VRRCNVVPKSSERGFVIVAVLWILVALSALATIFSVYLSNSAQALAVTDASLQTEALVSASVELTAYQLVLAGEKARPAQGSFQLRLDNAQVSVSFTSEAARVDLNLAPKELLANLFEVLGADPKVAEEAADRVDGWRTPPRPTRPTTRSRSTPLRALLTLHGNHPSPMSTNSASCSEFRQNWSIALCRS